MGLTWFLLFRGSIGGPPSFFRPLTSSEDGAAPAAGGAAAEDFLAPKVKASMRRKQPQLHACLCCLEVSRAINTQVAQPQAAFQKSGHTDRNEGG